MVVFDIIRKSVHKALDDEASGHDYAHVMRVFKWAVFIAQYEKDVNMDVLKAASLLHDIAYAEKFFAGDYSLESKTLAKEYLSRELFSQEEIDKILYSIEHHNIWLKSDIDVPVEVKVLRDADRLDHLGYTGIVRSIAYSSQANIRYIDCIYRWLELKNSMETKKGKELAKPRARIMKKFVKNMEAEY